MKINIDKKIFNPIYYTYGYKNNNRYQIYFGGASSGKSFFLAQRCVLDILAGNRNYLICRQVANTLRKSVFNEITKAMDTLKVTSFFDINKSDMAITCILNKKQILFTGLDDAEKIKSVTPINGVITDIWVEEATECLQKSIKQLDKRLRGVSKAKKRLTLSFNPVFKTHWLYLEYFGIFDETKQYVEYKEVSILKTTYKDNKHLTVDDIFALENEKDEYYKNVYTYGNWGVVGSVIFKNWKVENFDTKKFHSYINGLDFGFSPDPTAFVQCHYDTKNKKLYICKEIVAKEIFADELAPLIKKEVGGQVVFCDHNAPEMRMNLRRLGVNTMKAKKGRDSIMKGLHLMQSLEIIVHSSCKNVISELTTYKRMESPQGEILPIPEDKNNHCIDAIRYALSYSEVKK